MEILRCGANLSILMTAYYTGVTIDVGMAPQVVGGLGILFSGSILLWTAVAFNFISIKDKDKQKPA